MRLGLIWAQARAADGGRGVIGRDGGLPWHLPEDLARFRRLTTGRPVIMGRATWESLPPRFRPLPGRANIVLTRRRGLALAGADVVGDVAAAVAHAGDAGAWVIGGAQVYAATIAAADRLEVTEIDLVVDGDARAPELDASWQQVAVDPATGWHTSADGLRYRFRTYARGSLGSMPAAISLSVPARPFGAVLTAMVTPMTADGTVDLDAAVRLATHLVDHGHDGLVLNGTTGESPTTHAPEKADLIAAVVGAVGDRAVIVAGAGSNDTKHAVRMAEQAAAAGAHGLLVVSPYYSRPSQEGVYRHCVAVADATDLPVMLYDVPGRTVVRFAPETLDRLARHDRIVAVKDATGDVFGAARTMARTDLAYYSGDDALNLAFLAHGAAGVVSMAGHLVGDELAAIVRAIDAGDLVAARAAFVSILPAIDLICGSGNGVVRSKTALELLGLIPTRVVRLPHVEADDHEVDLVRTAMLAAGLLAAR